MGSNESKARRVGLIGVGLMGHGIAKNLLKHGHDLILLEHAGNQPVDDLKTGGARMATSIAELAHASDFIILCVTGSPQVEAIVMGAGGLLESLRAGACLIDCSTAIPSSTMKVAEAVRSKGARFVDAPMTRTAIEAAKGRLNLMVGGDEHDVNDCRPILECFAENITHVGDVGAGHRMKLLHNFVSLGFVALLSEAAACAKRQGVDMEAFADVLAKGGGGSVALERLRPYLADGDPGALRFAMSNAQKDLGYYTTMASDAGAAQRIAQAVLKDFDEGVEALGQQSMVLELVRVFSR